ncbi:hypothetical protein GCM10010349_61630 [Streptomyces flavofungini]|nr:hypothetical protein GCM10010349_61630 [Streptomyces flavofungini]
MVQVVEAQPLRVPADGGEFGQDRGVDGLGARAVQHRHGERVERADPAPQPARQHLFELAEGAYGALPDALDALSRGGAQAHRHGDRLVVVQEQRRQLVAAARSGAGVDGVAQLPQPVHVPPHGARRDAEPVGEVGSGPPPLPQGRGRCPLRWACSNESSRSSRAEVSNMVRTLPRRGPWPVGYAGVAATRTAKSLSFV